MEKICKTCGKVFISRKKNQKYCSKECRFVGLRKAQSDWAKRTRNVAKRRCALCGKEYIATNNQKHCSKECSNASNRYKTAIYYYEHGLRCTKPDIRDYKPGGIRYIPKKRVKTKNVSPQTLRTYKKICPMCDTEFLAKGKQRYCCKQCKNAVTRYINAKSAYRAGITKTEPKLEDYKKGGRLYDKSI